jgi:hypothetical protein
VDFTIYGRRSWDWFNLAQDGKEWWGLTFGFLKMREISWQAERLEILQGVCCLDCLAMVSNISSALRLTLSAVAFILFLPAIQ